MSQDTPPQIDSFEPTRRREALEAQAPLARQNPTGQNVNMHFHSFFSYNGQGWSPSHIAVEARQAGLYAAGLCDFDVLDGMEEFLSAGRLLGLRTAVFLETRAYLAEFGDKDINSPGEPGVAYSMGAGFVRRPEPGSEQARTLEQLRSAARSRNEQLIERINRKLQNLNIDYQTDVIPLAPSGNATERHIVSAYVDSAAKLFPGQALEGFWGMVLAADAADVRDLLADRTALEEKVRSRLAKRGGLGYVQPSAETFPPMETFYSWVASCDAIPMIAWLDGTSQGEADPEALFTCQVEMGAEALNIIPDRNWNFSDADKATKMADNLDLCVKTARKLNLPINIGTEMNKPGLPFVDDLAGPVLSRYADDFRTGAEIMVGHTTASLYANVSYVSDKARSQWPDKADRNAFFASIGALEPVDDDLHDKLLQAGPEKAFQIISDAADEGRW
ncbi:MAG: hypothetical protein ACLFUJ_04560 [Phycisphaerae bacterium]